EEVPLHGHAVEARVYAEDPAAGFLPTGGTVHALADRKSTRLNSSHVSISYAVFCLETQTAPPPDTAVEPCRGRLGLPQQRAAPPPQLRDAAAVASPAARRWDVAADLLSSAEAPVTTRLQTRPLHDALPI